MLVITPHLGDAVLGCGELLAAHPGAIVVTVFAGIPENCYVVPDWDAACGFASPQQAVRVRRREERSALEVLDAEPCWLTCPESQYRRGVRLEDVAVRLVRALRRHRADRIAIPLGMVSSDHAMTRQAARALLKKGQGEVLVYDDTLDGIGQLDAPPYVLQREEHNRYLKRRAAERYESLQRGFFSSGRALEACLQRPERYWRLPR